MKTSVKICILLSALIILACGSGDDDSKSSERPAVGPGPSDTATRDISDMQSAKDALYAAYAGISYGNADNKEDNGLFYNVMFFISQLHFILFTDIENIRITMKIITIYLYVDIIFSQIKIKAKVL